MVVNKRKKNTRRAGGTTHGWGSMKKRRGAGNRGGRGRSGSGKRGDRNKPSYWKTEKPGKYGFTSLISSYKTINLRVLDDTITTLVVKGKATEKNGTYEINLKDIGRDKLLASGKIMKKFKITTQLASKRAIEKVTQAGGEVKVLQASEETKPEKPEA